MLTRLEPDRPDAMILTAATLALGVALLAGLYAPPLFWLALGAAIVAGVAIVAWHQATLFCVVWLLVTSASLEMTLNDLVGPEMYSATIAAVKGTELALAAVCALRFGMRLDAFSPAWAYIAMLAAGMAHGLYPGLTAADSVRSLIGSAAPFAFGFCRVPRSWAEAVIRATKWGPLLVVLACVPLDLAGVRPLFVESGGARLAGLGHPAFLAGVCLPAIYACLIQLYRLGRAGDIALLLVNGTVLVLTGARAPLAYAVAVSGLSLAMVRGGAFTASGRIVLVLAAACALPLLVLLAGDLSDIRLFNVVVHETANLSGRDLLWPSFEAAADESPWVGWGIGAGNLVIPPTGPIALTLKTWAAHNEYLRMRVEGGYLGRALLIGLFVVWVFGHTQRLVASDRVVMRLVFAAFACHAYTDNVLISTPACVLFTFAIAVFARPRMVLPDSALGA